MEEENKIFMHVITKTKMVSTEVRKTLTSETYIGLQIQKRRHELKLTQEDLAKKIGLSRMSITNIEKGRHDTTVSKLQLLCQALKCSSTDLLGF